ncbi:MAG TPA: hypothetical protein VNR36_10150 [Pseudolysinimonas sp.]|nr:hypothetical protein [Pseudolysinimonas sp.]
MTDDPTRLRSQPSLTTSSGAIWLIVGGLFVVVAGVVLLFLAALPPAGVAVGALIAILVLYAAMVVVRFAVRRQRLMLGIQAVLLLAIAAVSLGAVLVVAGTS